MEGTPLEHKPSLWKKFEKFYGVVGLLAGIADKEFLNSDKTLSNESNFDYNLTKEEFIDKKEKIIKNPTMIPSYSSLWKSFDGEKIPYGSGNTTTWKDFFLFFLLFLLTNITISAIILGLWID